MSEARVGILTTLGAVLTVPMVEAMRSKGLLPTAIICDGAISEASSKIVRSRLDRSFRPLDISDIDLTETPTYFVTNHNSTKNIELVNRLQLDYLVSAGTPRILKAPILQATRGVINCHPGLLPKYRGCTALEWSLYNDDPVGATAHFMVEGIDEGPIISTREMKVEPFESYETIRTRMVYFQADLMAAAAKKAIDEDLRLSAMAPQSAGHYHDPITLEKLLAVKSKLARGDYRSS